MEPRLSELLHDRQKLRLPLFSGATRPSARYGLDASVSNDELESMEAQD